MRGRGRWTVVAAAVVALTAIGTAVAATSVRSGSAAQKPIIIGWAHDSTGQMAPFDGPALAAAQIRIAQLNKRKGARKIVLRTCDTQGNKPDVAKACAIQLLDGGAQVMMTTCDVEYAAPVVEEAINRGVLAVAPCIGTDQMGPKRFGSKGRLAFSFGNVAQDEGSAMAQYAWSKGWRRAALATDSCLIYFRNVVQAFQARWKQLGGKIVASETYQSICASSNNVQNVVSRLSGVKADVVVTATAGAFGALSTLVSGLRSLGNKTPILNSWAGDGTYWLPKNPKVTNYWFVTFASSFGDDPSRGVNSLAKQVHAATGGFITGPSAIDGIITAIRRAKGSTKGIVLAKTMEKFRNVPTISGKVSFSKKLHTVFGRKYRVIRIQNNVPKLVGTVRAKVVPKI
jgi:branched-chain amino acid transport system substrate-binding protein